MVDGFIRYDRMVETALRGVVREAIAEAVGHGLPGEHHFYITFATTAPGVDIPTYLRERYPDEMTIILQHQFFGLSVDDEAMAVTLSFSGKQERLRVPLAAVTTFADPSVNFALQFQAVADSEEEQGVEEERDAPLSDAQEPQPDSDPPVLAGLPAPPASDVKSEDGANKAETDPAEDGTNVITLDRFRKK